MLFRSEFEKLTVVHVKVAEFFLRNILKYQTATNLAEKYFSKSQNMILASGENFPDAVSAGPLATWLEGPILLSAKGSIENQTLNLIRDKADKLIIIGGQNAISKELEKFIVTITN